MNFTQVIKREILRQPPVRRSCQLALLAGVLESGGSWLWNTKSDGQIFGGFYFTSESEKVAEFILNLVDELFGVQMRVAEIAHGFGRDKLTFAYDGPRGGEYYNLICEFSGGAISDDEHFDEDCAQAFLKGAFLGGGSCTLPKSETKTGYHLEFVFEDERFAEDFQALLEHFQLIGNIVKRSDKAVVYLKSREAISDFLSVVGATSALRTLEEVSAEREERNNENRVSNCFAGNADRAAIASVVQVHAFSGLEAMGVLDTLPDSLKDTARARVNYPELSLAELAEKLQITKSGLSHRLRKLMKIYETEKKS